jgi:hypothetical protein
MFFLTTLVRGLLGLPALHLLFDMAAYSVLRWVRQFLLLPITLAAVKETLRLFLFRTLPTAVTIPAPQAGRRLLELHPDGPSFWHLKYTSGQSRDFRPQL